MCDRLESQVAVSLRKKMDGLAHEAMIDSCLASIIQALQSAGIVTVSCCCGHGLHDGYVLLPDRLLIVSPIDKEAAWARYRKDFDKMARSNEEWREAQGRKGEG